MNDKKGHLSSTWIYQAPGAGLGRWKLDLASHSAGHNMRTG